MWSTAKVMDAYSRTLAFPSRAPSSWARVMTVAATGLRAKAALGYELRLHSARLVMRHSVASTRSLSYTHTSQQPTSPSAADTTKPTLTLYTGTDCQLCDVAKAVLDDVAREVPFTLHLYNIRDDSMPDVARWRRAYQYDIPVLHLNGKEIARHRLQRSTVLEKIREASASRP